jgi:enamine deaminase RidA (YjgF/YER057c/UK114 family)
MPGTSPGMTWREQGFPNAPRNTLDPAHQSAREARNRFFASVTPPAAPAVTLVEVSKLYGPDFLIEIEAIAAA